MAEPCRSCGTMIIMANPDRPKADGSPASPMPVQQPPGTLPGNIVIWLAGDGTWRYRVLRDGETPGPGQHLGVSHFASCRDAAQWRRRGRR